MADIEKRYYDEPDWHIITEEQARDTLTKFFYDAEPVLADIRKGHTIHTDVAEYRVRQGKD